MAIFLIRHGKTDWNKTKQLQGQTDNDLNEIGIEEAKQIQSEIPKYNLDLIISSPLKRARQTADILNQITQIQIIEDARLTEIDYKENEGIPITQVDYEDIWRFERKQPHNAENLYDFFKRVYDCLDDIVEKYKDKNVLLVTHAGVARAIYCYYKGMQEDLTQIKLPNCKIVEIPHFDELAELVILIRDKHQLEKEIGQEKKENER